jgi:hypothetical protein
MSFKSRSELFIPNDRKSSIPLCIKTVLNSENSKKRLENRSLRDYLKYFKCGSSEE